MNIEDSGSETEEAGLLDVGGSLESVGVLLGGPSIAS